MSVDDVHEKIIQRLGQKIMDEGFEIESPDELRSRLEEVLREMTTAQGWSPLEEEEVEPPIDIMTATLKHGRIRIMMQELRVTGTLQNVLREIDRLLAKIRAAVHDDRALVGVFITVLLMKVDILVSGELPGTVDPSMLLGLLGEVEEFSHDIEPRVLKSRSDFAKKIRRALALRESLRKGG